MSMSAKPLTFAIPKGRILDEALPLMARAGRARGRVP
jgi:ATP phosphoribosyltransferase